MDQVRDEFLKKTEPANPKDSQLVTALVYGVLRHQRYLDAILADFSRHPLKKMKLLTLQALRVGLFQLCFMDRIPPSAAVNETVKALRSAKQPKWITGFVNGLLRNIERNRHSLPDMTTQGILPEAVRLSHPDWLFSRWCKRYGEEKAIAVCQVNNQTPTLTLRVNSSRLTREVFLKTLEEEGVTARPGVAPESVVLPDYRGQVSSLPGYDNGHFMVQDEGAQLISLMLCPFAGGKVLDACAGLGGKTVHLAQLITQQSQLVAIEPNKARFNLLLENIKRMGVGDTVTAIKCDLADFKRHSDSLFQAILVDAPCSGIGVIRRQPDIRWNRSAKDLLQYQSGQLTLLDEAAQLLAPGGVLVYATCSIEPEENEEVVSKFLQNHPELSISPPPSFPESGLRFIDSTGFLHMVPTEEHDGFFAARLEKN